MPSDRHGARVALLRCPILRAGTEIVSSNNMKNRSKNPLDGEKPFMDSHGWSASRAATKRNPWTRIAPVQSAPAGAAGLSYTS
jgi:hypothetical protein